MADRDRLIDLMLNAPQIPCIKGGRATGKRYQTFQNIADHLLANGVIVPPIKVDDTFYGVNETSYDAYCVYGFKWGKRKGDDENVLIVLTTYDMEFVWGEEAFATEEKAEKALKEREGNG